MIYHCVQYIALKLSDSAFSLNTDNKYSIAYPDSKVHGANMGPTWNLSAPDGPHVGPMNLAMGIITQVRYGLFDWLWPNDAKWCQRSVIMTSYDAASHENLIKKIMTILFLQMCFQIIHFIVFGVLMYWTINILQSIIWLT